MCSSRRGWILKGFIVRSVANSSVCLQLAKMLGVVSKVCWRPHARSHGCGIVPLSWQSGPTFPTLLCRMCRSEALCHRPSPERYVPYDVLLVLLEKCGVPAEHTLHFFLRHSVRAPWAAGGSWVLMCLGTASVSERLLSLNSVFSV